MANVLRTPFDVQRVIKEVFSDATIKGAVSETGFGLDCTLSKGANSFRVTQALDAKALKIFLRKRFDAYDLAGLLGRKSSSSLNLTLGEREIRQISLVPGLSGWKSFQRETFKGNPEDVLRTFLENEEGSDQLIQLGLAPSQINEEITSEDLQIFNSLCRKLEEENSESSDAIITNLKRNYPRVLSMLLSQKVEACRVSGSGDYDHYLKALQGKVIGQHGAVHLMASALASKGEKHSTFLFVGPTGVGKTELGKAVASLQGNKFAMLPMNRYTDATAVQTFFGSSSGFVGSTDRPFLAKLFVDNFDPQLKSDDKGKRVYTIKNAVLLLDELERSHPKLRDALFNLLDEGWAEFNYTEDSHSSDTNNICERYEFLNSVMIATSNSHYREIMSAFRRFEDPQKVRDHFVRVSSQSRDPSGFRAPFLARFTIIPFDRVDQGTDYQSAIRLIMGKQLAHQIPEKLVCRPLQVEDEPAVIRLLEKGLYGEGVDLRRIARFFKLGILPAIQSRTGGVDLKGVSLTIKPSRGTPPSLIVSVTVSLLGEVQNVVKDIHVVIQPM